MNPSTLEKLRLDQLTDEQCQTLHALVFDNTPPFDALDIYMNGGRVIVFGPTSSLYLWPDGRALACTGGGKHGIQFNAAKLTLQLKAWDIQFGPETPAEL